MRDRLYDNQWVGADGISPLALLDHGYAIAHFPQLPLRPSAENPAGMTGQLVDTISSLVEALVAAGAARDRIAIGGHCLGADASTQLLASSRLFCAGIACGGFYNLTNRAKGWPPTRAPLDGGLPRRVPRQVPRSSIPSASSRRCS